jgi:hypothetical protein
VAYLDKLQVYPLANNTWYGTSAAPLANQVNWKTRARQPYNSMVKQNPDGVVKA